MVPQYSYYEFIYSYIANYLENVTLKKPPTPEPEPEPEPEEEEKKIEDNKEEATKPKE